MLRMTTKDWPRLGRHIRRARIEQGMEQRDLADATRLSVTTVSNYERGREPARGRVPVGYYEIERALNWAPGSVDAVLAGGEPTAQQRENAPPPGPEAPRYATHPGADVIRIAGTIIRDSLVTAMESATAAEIKEAERLAIAELQRQGVLPQGDVTKQ